MEQINRYLRIRFLTPHRGIWYPNQDKNDIDHQITDVLRWVAPVTITGKLIFSDACNKKLTWDESIPPDVEKRWKDWTYIFEQSKTTAVLEVTSNYKSFLMLATWVMWSNIRRRIHQYLACFTISPRCLIKNCTKRAKYTKAGIDDSCSGIVALMLAKLQSNILVSLENYPIKSWHYWVDSRTVFKEKSKRNQRRVVGQCP